VNATEHAKACGAFFDAVDQRTSGTSARTSWSTRCAAPCSVARRRVGVVAEELDVDITPLVAGTIATWALFERIGTGGEFMSFSPEDLEAAFQ
jgi:hypothetical protein